MATQPKSAPALRSVWGSIQLTYVARIVDLAPEKGHITVERRAEGACRFLSTACLC